MNIQKGDKIIFNGLSASHHFLNGETYIAGLPLETVIFLELKNKCAKAVSAFITFAELNTLSFTIN